jgi:hypothetical protein
MHRTLLQEELVKTTNHTGVMSGKTFRHSYQNSGRQQKPNHHTKVTSPYKKLRPNSCATNLNPSGKAGEVKQHHSTSREMADGLMKLTKQLNNENDLRRGSVILQENIELSTGKQAAYVFASQYKDLSDRKRRREARREEGDWKSTKVTKKAKDLKRLKVTGQLA